MTLDVSAEALTPVQKFKLAVLSLDDFSDKTVEWLFFNTEVKNEDDIREIIGVLSAHRPQILKRIREKYLNKTAA